MALYRLKVHAAAREQRLERRGQNSFELWVRAPAERGRANASALAMLAAVELSADFARANSVENPTSKPPNSNGS